MPDVARENGIIIVNLVIVHACSFPEFSHPNIINVAFSPKLKFFTLFTVLMQYVKSDFCTLLSRTLVNK